VSYLWCKITIFGATFITHAEGLGLYYAGAVTIYVCASGYTYLSWGSTERYKPIKVGDCLSCGINIVVPVCHQCDNCIRKNVKIEEPVVK